MTREEAIAVILAHEAEIRNLGILSLSLFGSTVRGEAREESDVDLLVELSPAVGLFELVDIGERLRGWFGRPVDVVPRRALKPWLRETVEAEAEVVLAA